MFDLNYPSFGVVPLHLAKGEPEVPGHGVGPPGGPVIPLQVLQVAEEDCVDCRAVDREHHTEQNIADEKKTDIFNFLFLPRYDVTSQHDHHQWKVGVV